MPFTFINLTLTNFIKPVVFLYNIRLGKLIYLEKVRFELMEQSFRANRKLIRVLEWNSRPNKKKK